MIRLGWPVPAFWRLRPSADVLYPAPEAKASSGGRRRAYLPRPLRSLLKRRDDAMIKQFEERYEDLVDLLCVCAKEGVQPIHAQRYTELRTWFLASYRRVQPMLTRYLLQDVDSATVAEGQAVDPFVALFSPPVLDVLLHSEDVISHIQKTRKALAACVEDLRSTT